MDAVREIGAMPDSISSLQRLDLALVLGICPRRCPSNLGEFCLSYSRVQLYLQAAYEGLQPRSEAPILERFSPKTESRIIDLARRSRCVYSHSTLLGDKYQRSLLHSHIGITIPCLMLFMLWLSPR